MTRRSLLSLLAKLDLVPDRDGVLQTSREPQNSSFLNHCVYKFVSLQIAGQPLGYDAKENLSLNIEEADRPELADTQGLLLFWYQYSSCSAPSFRYDFLLPCHYH